MRFALKNNSGLRSRDALDDVWRVIVGPVVDDTDLEVRDRRVNMREEFFERLAYSSRLVEGRYDDREANGAGERGGRSP